MNKRGVVALTFAIIVLALPAFSQSCSLCYTQAASSGARMIQALKSGILILVIPPTFMTIGFIRLAYRKSSQFKYPEQDDSGNDW